MLSDRDWNRLQELTVAEQRAFAERKGLLCKKRIIRRMREAEAGGRHPLQAATPHRMTIEEAIKREFGEEAA